MICSLLHGLYKFPIKTGLLGTRVSWYTELAGKTRRTKISVAGNIFFSVKCLIDCKMKKLLIASKKK